MAGGRRCCQARQTLSLCSWQGRKGHIFPSPPCVEPGSPGEHTCTWAPLKCKSLPGYFNPPKGPLVPIMAGDADATPPAFVPCVDNQTAAQCAFPAYAETTTTTKKTNPKKDIQTGTMLAWGVTRSVQAWGWHSFVGAKALCLCSLSPSHVT